MTYKAEEILGITPYVKQMALLLNMGLSRNGRALPVSGIQFDILCVHDVKTVASCAAVTKIKITPLSQFC
ncbi:MAG: hypothetical protein LBL04_06385 [Bacteroidales bacterium]|jgi:hypothetical protein|nr:hypothetical protein [Bacteroidales bacterium]